MNSPRPRRRARVGSLRLGTDLGEMGGGIGNMPDELHIQHLLEEILDSGRTPEEVCAATPDLLNEVRLRWERLRRVGWQLEVLFPARGATTPDAHRAPPESWRPWTSGRSAPFC